MVTDRHKSLFFGVLEATRSETLYLRSATFWDFTQQRILVKYSHGTTTQHCIKCQKSADLIYIAAEAWNH